MQKVIKISKGLDIKLKGEAQWQEIPHATSRYALVSNHFRWITPKLTVKEGDKVLVGTPVFHDKDDENIIFVSPVSGTVKSIIRGEKRKIEYIEFSSDGQFQSVPVEIPKELDQQNIQQTLLKYGLWNTIRQLPFNTIADRNQQPKAVFVSGFDTAPLAPKVAHLVKGRTAEIQKGIDVMRTLSDTNVYLSLFYGGENEELERLNNVERRYFKGKHPAGNIATQVHHISPINKGVTVWHIDLQALVMIGRLFEQQKLDFSKTVAVCGSALQRRGYVRLVQGADVSGILEGNLACPTPRLISGNVLTGKAIDVNGFIGYYHHQLTVIPEGGERRVFGWMAPGFTLWSNSRAYLSWLFPSRKYNINTSLNGGIRAMMFNTDYDKVFPFDILPVQLLKACVIGDVDLMENLGIYEVTEEDFAICEVICPSKMAWQEIIFKGLTLLKG